MSDVCIILNGVLQRSRAGFKPNWGIKMWGHTRKLIMNSALQLYAVLLLFSNTAF